MTNFCTLFDKNYIDKALVMYHSLVKVGTDFCLYILCFDDVSFDILSDMKLDRVVLEKLEDFEDEQLLKIKKTRSKAEYCWTCTATSIEYFMKKYGLNNCAYIDADLYFYANPQVLIEEMGDSHIGIIGHRFGKIKKNSKSLKSGKYCVEFNYFDTDEESQKALKWWKDVCYEWCYHKYEEKYDGQNDRYGDQMYLEQFPKRFKGVHEFSNLGGGVAPWNIKQYKLSAVEGDRIFLNHEDGQKNVELIFYHFQNLKYLSNKYINVNSSTKDKKLKRAIYYPYLRDITKTRETLKEKYGLKMEIRKSYSSNKLKAFIQRYVMPFKVRNISDIVNLDKLVKTDKN